MLPPCRKKQDCTRSSPPKTGQNAGRTAAASSAEKTESGRTESSRAESGRMKADSGLFTADMLAQLDTVFSRMESSLQLELYLDDTPLSRELKAFMEELCALTDRLSVREEKERSEAAPCVRICREDGSWTGLAFHGVPGGHEFTSFVLGLYNAAGPGQTMDEESLEMAKKLGKTDLKVLVSLSCTMCPELVTAAQRIAVENPEVSARVYDLNHFPGLRERYRVMSVPCLVVNDGEKVSFGKKNVRQLLELLTEQNQQG